MSVPSAKPPRVDGFGARQAALRMLDSVLRRGDTLAMAAAASRKLAPNDQALALAIAGETLRRLPDLDEWIDSATQRPLPDDSKARMVLRIALAQKIGLNTPDHAIVATALPQVEGGPRRLVHGVLGTLLRRPIPDLDPPRLPAAVEMRWASRWGGAMVDSARRQIAVRPPLDLSFASDVEAKAFAAAAGGASMADKSVRIDSSNVAQLPGFADGKWWVQDLAASLPARLIPQSATAVVDLCAAPGGKTMQLAAAGHDVTAVDLLAERLQRLQENLQRTGLTATAVVGDALLWKPASPPGAILLDAPCSATGTFRRHPEVLYRARPSIIDQSAQLQARLLDRSAGWLEPGGTLVYAVCSLERAEGEEAISAFLNRNPHFRIDPPRPGELPDFVPVAKDGWVRILPGLLDDRGGLDGFFIARLTRVAK
ncbi:MAG: RsmB/NOP family class I SAM-dependent RNA methyltransferase [Pseudomonadota bacterium]